jgi:CRP/FNR family transcriptional regulator, cyclic AMP receptor protein
MASTATIASNTNRHYFDLKAYLAQIGEGRTLANYRPNEIICAQGDLPDAAFYIERGHVKLSIVSTNGKEAVLSLRGDGDFFGVRSLVRVHRRATTATALTDCAVVRIPTAVMTRLLREEPHFVEIYTNYLMLQHVRDQERLADLLTNSAEKRLARILLQLADFGPENNPKAIAIRINQETLAEMVGTTRSRVNHFMSKFRRLGLIEYKGNLVVHRALSDVLRRG